MKDRLHNFGKQAWARCRQMVCRRLRRDERGVAAVEFAMIVPVMFILFVGAVEFSQAITVDRRVTQVASSTADLIARTKAITTSEVQGVMEIITELLKPYEVTPLKLTVANVVADPSDATKTTVCWSYNHNGGANSYTNGQTYTLPTGVVQAGESVVVTEVTYAYTPILFNYFIQSTMTFTETFYLKPRLSNTIDFNGNKCL